MSFWIWWIVSSNEAVDGLDRSSDTQGGGVGIYPERGMRKWN